MLASVVSPSDCSLAYFDSPTEYSLAVVVSTTDCSLSDADTPTEYLLAVVVYLNSILLARFSYHYWLTGTVSPIDCLLPVGISPAC